MRVYIDFNVLKKNGEEYQKFATELNDIITNLKETQKNIASGWTSQNANTYNALLEKFVGTIQVDANRMQRYSNVILQVNDNFKETDLEYAKTNSIETMEDKPYGKY